MIRLGVEVGGTFTDLIAIDGDELRLLKVPSTPSEPERAVLDAIRAAQVDLGEVAELVHGSTVATNTILERKGAPTAFVTTHGFRDILEIQRHDRRNIYDVHYRKPLPIVRREHCFEVAERIGGDGAVIARLDESAVADELIPRLAAGGFRSVAICLLNAHENAAHEQRLETILKQALPDLKVTISSSVIREFREYERASTTALSTYVQPVIDRYLERLEGDLSRDGFVGQLSIMQSNGGRIPVAGMRQSCISAFLSGPAAGVIGAIRQAARSGIDDIVTFDMGGTSSDVCLVSGGEAEIAVQSEVDGLPIRYPMTDIVTIGAGGGSIVSVDEGGMLRVGPRSAGASPGPACYARGGALPTITDAHLICGTLRSETFLGGAMPLDEASSRDAFQPIAAALGVSIEEAADSALSLAAANIVRAIQTISTERGRDPRDFALVPFGGAGPLACTEIAEELGAVTVLIPPNPGVMSAFGLLAADHMLVDVAAFQGIISPDTMIRIRETAAVLTSAARTNFVALGMDGEIRFRLLIDLRFRGQAFELQVPIDPDELEAMTAEGLRERFDAAYAGVFMSAAPGTRDVEIVALRLMSIQPNPSVPKLRWSISVDAAERDVTVRRRGVANVCREITVDGLATGQERAGPLLVVSDTSSVFVESGWSIRRDIADNLILTKGAR